MLSIFRETTLPDSIVRLLTSVLMLLAGTASSALASGIVVTVEGRDGSSIEGVATWLMPVVETDSAIRVSEPAAAVMTQTDSQFVPHTLIVEAGAQVSFPNDDSVSHHVYSFSDAKRFQLDLYRGNTHPPQLFDVPGLVVIGCNIHDGMLGYILVVDTPFFGVSNADGLVTLSDLPNGDYQLHVWTPRSDPDDLPPTQMITIDGSAQRSVTLKLTGKLRPPHGADGGSLSWDDY